MYVILGTHSLSIVNFVSALVAFVSAD